MSSGRFGGTLWCSRGAPPSATGVGHHTGRCGVLPCRDERVGTRGEHILSVDSRPAAVRCLDAPHFHNLFPSLPSLSSLTLTATVLDSWVSCVCSSSYIGHTQGSGGGVQRHGRHRSSLVDVCPSRRSTTTRSRPFQRERSEREAEKYNYEISRTTSERPSVVSTHSMCPSRTPTHTRAAGKHHTHRCDGPLPRREAWHASQAP